VNRDELNVMLATEPATPSQVGVVVRQFERLGFTGSDRAERLTISAALLGLDGLGSTKDLTMGQAGQLYRTLAGIRGRGELRAAARLAGEDQAGGPTLADVIMRAAVLIRFPPLNRE
jgi:hypothetical protein